MNKKTLESLIGVLNRCQEEYSFFANLAPVLDILNGEDESPQSKIQMDILHEHYGTLCDKTALELIALVDALGEAGAYQLKDVLVKIAYRTDKQKKLLQIVMDNPRFSYAASGMKVIIILGNKPILALVHHILWYEKLFNEE